MSNEELVKLYQQGDESVLGELLEQNRGMVHRLANRFYLDKLNAIDIEDLIQEGFIGIMLAVDKYDPDHENKAQFITYAVHWINMKMYRFVKNRNTSKEISLNVPKYKNGDKDSDNNRELQDYIEGVNYSYENIEERVYLDQLRKDLERVMDESTTLNEREVLKLHYGWYSNEYMTTDEVGEVLSVPGAKIRNYESKAIRKLRNSKWARTVFKKHYSAEEISRESMFKIRKEIRAGQLMDWYL